MPDSSLAAAQTGSPSCTGWRHPQHRFVLSCGVSSSVAVFSILAVELPAMFGSAVDVLVMLVGSVFCFSKKLRLFPHKCVFPKTVFPYGVFVFKKHVRRSRTRLKGVRHRSTRLR